MGERCTSKRADGAQCVLVRFHEDSMNATPHEYGTKTEATFVLEGLIERLPPVTHAPADCTHEDFAVAAAVARLTDSGVICAEIRIVCVNCRLPFRFKGVTAGWSPEAPRVTIDGLELMVPIEPEVEKQLQGSASYTMPAIPTRH